MLALLRSLDPDLLRNGDDQVAVVVGVRAQVDTGVWVVSVEVPQDRAAELAARAATGNVAVVLDSRER